MSFSTVFSALLALTIIVSANAKPFKADDVCGYEACPAYDPDVLNVHIVAHSHDDVGWLKTVDQYYDEDVDGIISTVIDALVENPVRRYIQVETAFFKKWWEKQDDARKQDVIDLTNSGRLEFISGGWAMNDEAAVHYHSTIDQFTLGFRYLQDNVGECARPRNGWQIDPFGHSREQASISAHLGFDSLAFWRLDYRDKNKRLADKTGDLIWRGTQSLGNTSDVFTSIFLGSYFEPNGFCYDMYCGDPEINESNQQSVTENFAAYSIGHAQQFPTNNILVPFGGDFRYHNADKNFRNMDKLVEGFDLYPQTYDGRPIRVMYSTPTCYTKFVHEYVTTNEYNLQIKTDDFFPYADNTQDYWTGYFTSRPASKRYERSGNNLLQVAKQLSAVHGGSYENEDINALKESVGIMQHHDAITGTEKQHVVHNYHLVLTSGMNQATQAVSEFLSSSIGGEDSEDFEFKSCLLANVTSCVPSQGEQFTVAVYNPLSRTVSSPISIPVNFEDWTILDPEDQEVNYQISDPVRDFSYITDVPISRFNLDFLAEGLPALGYKVYRFETSTKKKISNNRGTRLVAGFADTSFEIDNSTGLLISVTMNGLTLEVSQELLYYSSKDNSGAYLFSPDPIGTQRIAEGPVKVTPISGDVYEGVIQEFSDWAQQTIRVYAGDRSFIEFDWTIGPIEQHHNQGTEVIARYSTYLRSEGDFYTDSNGREVLKRTRNSRPDYEYTNEQPVAGNYYPVNSKIVIKDEGAGVEVSVLTDRSEGGSSLTDGEVELMVHRVCHHDDARGVDEILNEQEYEQGIVVRGKHYLVLGNIDDNNGKSLAAIERDIAQRKLLAPWTFITEKDVSENLQTLQDSALTADLPDNVQLLTLEPWQDGTLLIRLEHVVAKGEDQTLSTDVDVDLTDAFTKFTITELQETALGGNILLENISRLHWPGSEESEGDSPVLNVENRKLRAVDDLTITLAPMQIRTFWAKITTK